MHKEKNFFNYQNINNLFHSYSIYIMYNVGISENLLIKL